MREKRRRTTWQKVQLPVVCLVLLLAAAVVILLGVLTVTEYKPADVENLEVVSGASAGEQPGAGDAITVMTWNIGYGALGDNADFFMDGGKGVQTASPERVQENMEGIVEAVQEVHPDVLFVQEADRNSKRSYHMDETAMLTEAMQEYDSVFANNYKVLYVPYPIPTIGGVDSGIATFSGYVITEAQRVQLPSPFSWPIRLGNLKRCLEISRIDLDDAQGRQLVLVNLHLEAYDSGEGKIAQTKMLAEVLQAEADKGNYVIAGGDFNQIFSAEDGEPWGVKEGLWAPGELDTTQFESGWQFLMDESVPTCRSLDQPFAGKEEEDFQFYLIDGFIVSDNITVRDCRTVDLGFRNSDHNPVILEAELQ